MSIEAHDHCMVCEHCDAHEAPEFHAGKRCAECFGVVCRNCDDPNAEPCPHGRSMVHDERA